MNKNNSTNQQSNNNGGGGKAKGLSYSGLSSNSNFVSQGTNPSKSDSKAVKDKENRQIITSSSANDLSYSTTSPTKPLEFPFSTADKMLKKKEVTNSDGEVTNSGAGAGAGGGALESDAASATKRKRGYDDLAPGEKEEEASTVALVGTATKNIPAAATSSKGSEDDDDSMDGTSIGCFGAKSKGGVASAIGAVFSLLGAGGGEKDAFQPAVEEKKDNVTSELSIKVKKRESSIPTLPNPSDPSSSQPLASFGASDPSQQAKSSDADGHKDKRRKIKPSDTPDSSDNSLFGEDFEGVDRPDVNEKLKTQRKKIQVLTTEDEMNKATITSLEGETLELRANLQGVKRQLEEAHTEVQQARAAAEEANRRTDAVAREAATRVAQLQATIELLTNDVARHQAEEERLHAVIRSAQWLLRNA